MLGKKTAVGAARVKCEGCNSTFHGDSCPSCGNWEQYIAGTKKTLEHRDESLCSSCGFSATSRQISSPEQAPCPQTENHDRADSSGVELNSMSGAAAMAVAAGGTPRDADVTLTFVKKEKLPARVIQKTELETEQPEIKGSVEKKEVSKPASRKTRHSKQRWVLTPSPENGSKHGNDECGVRNYVDETTGTESEVQRPAAQMRDAESVGVEESIKILQPRKQPWCLGSADYFSDGQDGHSENVPPEVRSTVGTPASRDGKISNSECDEVNKTCAGGNFGNTVELAASQSNGSPADESRAPSAIAVSAVNEEVLSRHHRTLRTQLALPHRYQLNERGGFNAHRPSEIQRLARRPEGPTAAGRLRDGDEMDVFERVEESGVADPASANCGKGSDTGDRRSLGIPEEADGEMGKTECDATEGLSPKNSRDPLEFKHHLETSDPPAAYIPVAADIPFVPEHVSKSCSWKFRHRGSRSGSRRRRGIATSKPEATIIDEVDKSINKNGEAKVIQREAEFSVVSDIAPVHLAVAAPREDGPPPPPEPRCLQYARDNTRRKNSSGGRAPAGAGVSGSGGGWEEDRPSGKMEANTNMAERDQMDSNGPVRTAVLEIRCFPDV